jgi:anthranilate phosphoribosyltransferase
MRVHDLPLISAAPFLRRIGRASAIGGGLSQSDAAALFQAMFAHQLEPAALGAVLLTLRIKGESTTEMLAALEQLQAHLRPLTALSGRPCVSIPSYNGARKLPQLTWLLAQLLADQGVQVVVHGIDADPTRVSCWRVATGLGHKAISTAAQAHVCFERGEPVFYPLAHFSPALHEVVQMRTVLGVRNIGHTLAKLINPFDQAKVLRLSSYTHPEFARLQQDVFAQTQALALVTRATEGEVVANVRQSASIATLPAPDDLHGTCNFIQATLAGELPVPEALKRQVETIMNTLETNP